MSIKEIIDAERWSQKRRDGWWGVKHNSSLDRIEASVTARIKELEKQVSTLEKAFIFEGKKYEERIKDLEDELNGYKDKLEVRDRLVLSLRGRIADLEAENTRLLEKLIIKAT